jgi:lysozyme
LITTTGVDISHHNGHVDFGTLKANGVQFVIMKATEGLGVDPMFHDNYARAHAAGMLTGVYHFFRTNVDAVAQAKHFLATAPPKAGDLIASLDVETNDGGTSVAEAAHAAIMHIKVSTGRYPFLYSSMAFHAEFLTGVTQCPLWLARYGGLQPVPLPEIWQHTDHAKLGAPNPVDGNFYFGALEGLIAKHTYSDQC